MKNDDVDPIASIYKLLLKFPSKVLRCSRTENYVTIEIMVFDNPNETDPYEHDGHIFQFELYPGGGGLVYDYPVENKLWSHY